MGLTGNLTRILLGIGLGVLAVSCLTVTICFARCASKFYPSDLLKLGSKISYDYKNDLYSCCIAIAVLGCFSAVSAVASIALSIVLESQTLILIIVGGVSALFGLGCIVAEGMFTQRSVKSLSMHSGYSDELYENIEPFYRNYRSNKDAQEYIKDSIQIIWEQAYLNFYSLYSSEVPRFREIYQKIGSDDPEESLTYADLWNTNRYYCGSNSQYLYYTGNFIAMCYNSISMPVASVKFNYSKSAKIKRRICWPNSKRTDYNCKDFSSNEEIYAECNIYEDVPRLNEYIISGHYYESRDVNYEVQDFPVAFELLSSRELKDASNAEYNARKAVFPDSYRHYYKITGKKCAEARWKEEKNHKPDKLEREVYISPYKVNSWEEYLDKCENDEDFECDEPVSERELYDGLNSINKDYNKGKSTSKTTKYYDGASRTILNDKWLNCYLLYNLALINLIIQIFGIVLWACGRFLGFALGGSDEKTPSDGEGAA